VPYATLGGSTKELSTYLLLCLGYDLLRDNTKVSWLFADCKRHCAPGNMRLQTGKVRVCVHLSIYPWTSSKLRWIQPYAIYSDFEHGSGCRVGCALNEGLD